MSRKVLLIGLGALVALAASFWAGRYSVPVKYKDNIQVVTRTEYKDRIIYQKVAAKHIERKSVKTPDGTITTTTVSDQHSTSTADRTNTGGTSETIKHEIERVTLVPKLRLSIGPEFSYHALSSGNLKPQIAADVKYRLLGPVDVSARGVYDLNGGWDVSAGLKLSF